MEKEKEVEKTEFTVRDPQVLRPRALPLVIEPSGGVHPKKPNNGWASKAQKALADTLNGYAYKNPKKWAEKKDDRIVNGKVIKGLLTLLKEAADAPDPVESNLSYTNKLAQ